MYSRQLEKTTVYVSLGGNEGEVLQRCKLAIDRLAAHYGIEGVQSSHFYLTKPFEMDSLCWFVNAVCSFQTFLTAQQVFALTQEIERDLGKIPKAKTASRPIDIDLLFYGHHAFYSTELEIPHPRWGERLFVLVPLSDLTDHVEIERKEGRERYELQQLIQPLLKASPDSISLFEVNINV